MLIKNVKVFTKDKKFKQTDSPRFYFEQQMMIETKKK